MDIRSIILIIVFLANLFLGLLLFIRGKRNKVSTSYAIVTWAIALWTISMILYRGASVENSVFWCRILYFSAAVIPYLFLRFSFLFPSAKLTLSKFKSFLIVIPSIIIVFFTLYPGLVIKDVIIYYGQEKEIIFGPFYIFYSAYISVYFAWPLFNLFRKYRVAIGILRSQLRYMLFGTAASVLFGMFFNLVMPWIGDFRFNWMGQVTTLIMVFSVSYAILKYRLMDIRMVIKRSTIFSGIVIIITAVYVMAAFLLGWIFFGGVYTLRSQIITGLIVAILTAIGFRPLLEWLKNTTDAFLFKGDYRPQELMSDVSDVLSKTLDLDRVINTLEEQITKALRLENMEVVVFEKEDLRKDSHNISLITENSFAMTSEAKKALNKLVGYFKNQKEVLVLEELKRKHSEGILTDKNFLYIRELEKLKSALVIPLVLKEKLLGLFLLQAKKSGDMFTNEDIKTLETIASQASIAIENARLYEEMKDFSKTLQKEVQFQTKELRDANIRLQQLDKAKSEFISLASHQLRTPLSIIKGYISMMIEGSWGKVNKEQGDQLEKVYLSNERLIKLVDDLLAVSRIESGRLEFDYKMTSLEEMVISVVEEFKKVAADKGLYLKYIESKKKIPLLKIDALKIRQVVQNLVDNALHYTTKGGASIYLKKDKDKVIFSIKDTGIGVSDKEKVTLFEKFSRGQSGAKIHTEGTGLGLYLAAKLVTAHKGRTWVESEGKDKGSTFYFELPIKSRKGK